MTQDQKTAMNEEIVRHGINLNKIFNTGFSPYILCKQLHSLEIRAHKLATDYCNGEHNVNTDNWEEKCKPILDKVRKLLNVTDNYPIFINGDARGYALKIEDSYVREHNLKIHTDWGGYGILSPDFTPND